jgi:hypothetical protein
MFTIEKQKVKTNDDEGIEKSKGSYLTDGNVNGIIILEIIKSSSYKTRHIISILSSNFTPRH